MKLKFTHKFSFTLIEMLIVIVIIGILAAALVPRLKDMQGRARDVARKTDMNLLNNAIQIRFLDYGNYPPTRGYVQNNNYSDMILYLVTPGYIPSIINDPLYPSRPAYLYARKDYNICVSIGYNNNQQYAFYTTLEFPSAQDTATLTDACDNEVKTLPNLNYNYRIGN